jgi:hypothetical protein
MKLAGETEVLGGKTCPSATLSTTNPTWTAPGSNPGLRGEKVTPLLSRLRAVSHIFHSMVVQQKDNFSSNC